MASRGRDEEGVAYTGAMGVPEGDCLLLTPWWAPWATQASICLGICKTILSLPEGGVQVEVSYQEGEAARARAQARS